VALRLFRIPLALGLIALAALAVPGRRASARVLTAAELELPALQDFVRLVQNGDADQLRGVYAPELFADMVVQQPKEYPAFVSPRQNVLTEFSTASQLGSTGLLAHNYLAGAQFARIEVGQPLYLIRGDGMTTAYVVTDMFRFQALQPNSADSEFLDLASGARLSATALFSRMYSWRGTVVFQTCIASDGTPTWGRLFIVAERSLEYDTRDLPQFHR